MRQNGTAEFGPIFLAKDEVSDSIGESYNGKTGELQQTLTLPGHGSYLVLIPPFFAPSRNATPDPLIRLLPSSDVVVAGDNTNQTVISLRPIGLDLLSLPTVHITRPLREMNLVGTVSEPEPSELIGHDGSPLGGTTIQLDLTRNNFDILNLSDIFVATGELEMGVFVNGSAYSAGANLQIRLFDNYSDAVNSTNAVARFNVASSDRWVILETPLVNQQQLYITIGINGIADVLINPLVYSNNPYY
jgi:hypothetical protein